MFVRLGNTRNEERRNYSFWNRIRGSIRRGSSGPGTRHSDHGTTARAEIAIACDREARGRDGEACRFIPQHPSAASAADYNGLVKKYCVGCHNDRNKDRAGSLTLASFDIAKAGQEADVAERMIRKLQASMMPPPGMPRPEPAAYQALHPHARDRRRRARDSESESGRPHVPAPESRRVRARDQGPARARRRRRRLAAARHDERELRQHRRRAGAVADAARVVSERRGRHQPHGGRRQERAVDRHDLHESDLRVAAPVGSRRGRAVRHARRHGRQSRVPGRRRVRVRDDVQLAATTRASRTSTSRSTASASRCVHYENGSTVAGADGRGATPLSHRADPRQGRPAQGGRRVRAPHRRSVRRSDPAARLVVRGRRLRRRRHHDAAAHARPRRSAGRSRPPASRRRRAAQKIFTCRPTSPADERAVRAPDRHAARRRSVPPSADRSREVDRLHAVLRRRRGEGRVRSRRPHGARSDSRQPALHLPPRARADATRARAAPIAWPTSTSRRGCRSSSGACRRTRSCSTPPSAASCRRRRPREAGAPHARRSARATRSPTASPAQWLRLQDVDKVHPGSELLPELRRATSPTRCAPRPSCSSTTSSAKTAACSICCAPTTRSSTSGSRGTTASRASPATSSAASRIPTPRAAASSARAAMLVQTLAREPHVAGAARQVGDGSAARHAAAAAAAGHSGTSRRRPRVEGRPPADDARAHGDASQEPDVQLVPPLHGSDRPGARQLRRHRQVAQARERHAARHARRLLRRHPGDDRRRS